MKNFGGVHVHVSSSILKYHFWNIVQEKYINLDETNHTKVQQLT